MFFNVIAKNKPIANNNLSILGMQSNNNLDKINTNYLANNFNQSNNINNNFNNRKKLNKINHLDRNRPSIASNGYEKLSMSFTKDSNSLQLFSDYSETGKIKENKNKLV